MEKAKKGKKKKQSSTNKVQQLAMEQNLTPSIDYYKSIAASYKKSVENLPINKGKKAEQQEEADPQRQRKYETPAQILRNAKSEKSLLKNSEEQKEFKHDAAYKESINKYFKDMDQQLLVLNQNVSKKLNHNRKDFFDRFKGEMYNVHQNYRILHEETDDELNKLKLKKEILDRQAERDWYKNECNAIDNRCHERSEQLEQLKASHNEVRQEKKFLDEQIVQAEDNKKVLQRKLEQLKKELEATQKRTQEGFAPQQSGPNRSLANRSSFQTESQAVPNAKQAKKHAPLAVTYKEDAGESYGPRTVEKFRHYVEFLKKRNQAKKKEIVKKNLAGAHVDEAQYPFEIMFSDAVQKVKEDIIERKQATNRRAMNTSKSSASMRLGPDAKTPPDAKNPFEHKEIFGGFETETEKIKLSQLTDHDRRAALEKFLQNEEVSYLVYGLLFPQGVMEHAQHQQQLLQKEAMEKNNSSLDLDSGVEVVNKN